MNTCTPCSHASATYTIKLASFALATFPVSKGNGATGRERRASFVCYGLRPGARVTALLRYLFFLVLVPATADAISITTLRRATIEVGPMVGIKSRCR